MPRLLDSSETLLNILMYYLLQTINSTNLYVQEKTWTCMKTGIIVRCLPRNKKELKNRKKNGEGFL